MRIHAVHKLIDSRKEASTRPFRARGAKVDRCERCCIAKNFCICEHQPDIDTDVSALIIMSENEVLKPSNTGRLIADTIKNTFCFQWSRTEPASELLVLLDDPNYQPVVVFPQEYVENKARIVSESDSMMQGDKTPLLIFIDGSWREARRIFRKSPYLDRFPVISVTPEKVSEYIMRSSDNENHLSTAEVASLVLEQLSQPAASKVLSSWFAVFRESYLLSKTRLRTDLTRPALKRYLGMSDCVRD
ncbi:tRNA-uridine aminocarboxypropyltransferase [Vibrio sp. HN007]|uniref:tRNA-uridine aminocarboxypropyltransferase n=1 Tax=Vibrio iocasae TaxID=3098914 RepID=UPI0035D44BF4